MRLARPVTGRWALLAGLVVGGGMLALGGGRHPVAVDLMVCAAGGVMAAWAVLHVAGVRERRRAERADAERRGHLS